MAKKRKRRKKKSKLKVVIIVLLVLFLLLVGLIGGLIYSVYKDQVGVVPKEKVDPTADSVKIAQVDKKDDEVVNILLVGTDSRDPDSDMGRSDSMMMVSYNRTDNTATMVSFLRDSYVPIDGYGESKLGHSFAYGGVGLTINTLNEVYDLDIQNYVTINFDNLVNIIDELDGIEVYISEEEAEYYRENGMPDITSGNVTLTGSQALTHARNRTLGYDYERTRRQRSVLYGIYKKVMKKKDPSTILPLINYAMTQVDTNMSVKEIYALATEILGDEDLKMQQAQVPKDGTFEDATVDGMSVLKLDIDENIEYLKELLY